jgi:hypothetical protein
LPVRQWAKHAAPCRRPGNDLRRQKGYAASMEKAAFKKKWDNYWYYYKIHTIVAIFIVIVLAILIRDCATKVQPDVTVIVATQSVSQTDGLQASMQNYFSTLTADVNGDGKKSAECQIMALGSTDAQSSMAYQVKLAAELSDNSTLIYIFDDKTASSYTSESGSFVKIATIVPGISLTDECKLPVDKTTLASQSFASKLSGCGIYVRNYDTSSTKASYLKTVQNQLNIIKKLAKT